MCVIVRQYAGKELIPTKNLQECRRSNPHGMGIMFPAAGGDKVEIFKGVDSDENFKILMGHYRGARKRGEPVVMHFRVKTHGEVNKENCHPFRVDRRLALAHNGTLTSILGDLKGDERAKEVSDSRWFTENILGDLRNPYEDMDRWGVRRMIGEMVGTSRVCIMRSDGKMWTWNSHAGVERKEWNAWFSNHSFLIINPSHSHSNRGTTYRDRRSSSKSFFGWEDLDDNNKNGTLQRQHHIIITDDGVDYAVRFNYYVDRWQSAAFEEKKHKNSVGSWQAEARRVNSNDMYLPLAAGLIRDDGALILNMSYDDENKPKDVDYNQMTKIFYLGSEKEPQFYPWLFNPVGEWINCKNCSHDRGIHLRDGSCDSMKACPCDEFVAKNKEGGAAPKKEQKKEPSDRQQREKSTKKLNPTEAKAALTDCEVATNAGWIQQREGRQVAICEGCTGKTDYPTAIICDPNELDLELRPDNCYYCQSIIVYGPFDEA